MIASPSSSTTTPTSTGEPSRAGPMNIVTARSPVANALQWSRYACTRSSSGHRACLHSARCPPRRPQRVHDPASTPVDAGSVARHAANRTIAAGSGLSDESNCPSGYRRRRNSEGVKSTVRTLRTISRRRVGAPRAEPRRRRSSMTEFGIPHGAPSMPRHSRSWSSESRSSVIHFGRSETTVNSGYLDRISSALCAAGAARQAIASGPRPTTPKTARAAAADDGPRRER